MEFKIIYIVPVISALIGWITNYLAVKMIFRPKTEINILGIKIQGLIPKRKLDLAEKIGETVENELISHKDIHDAVNTESFHEDVLNSIIATIEKFITEKLSANPLVAMMLSGDAADTIKSMIKDEMRKMLPNMMEDMFEKVEDRLDFKKIVKDKIEQFELDKLEEIIYNIAAKELKAIEIFGGVLGFVVGIVQLGIISLAG